MAKVRKVEGDMMTQVFKEMEYSSTCSECGCDVGVMPPKKLIDKTLKTDDDSCIHDWLGEHCFYCPDCQKDLDCDEMD